VKRHGDDRLHAPPETLFVLERLEDEAAQGFPQDLISAVFEEQDEVFQLALIQAGGPMDREGRSLFKAGKAEMGLAGAFEKPAAAETI
jgi:hypothetical protein